MDRYRQAIEAEVDRRLGRGEPPPAARMEIVRRFRSFCRLACIDLAAARPSFEGLSGTSPLGLEHAIEEAVKVACDRAPPREVQQALRELESRFRAGIRRVMQPEDPDRREKRRRRRSPNAGRRVRAAIDRIGDAYLALCLDTGRLYDVNPAAETLLGANASQLLERSLAELISPLCKAEYEGLEARLDSGEQPGTTDLVLMRPGGGLVNVEMTVANHTIGGRRLAIFTAREKLAPNR